MDSHCRSAHSKPDYRRSEKSRDGSKSSSPPRTATFIHVCKPVFADDSTDGTQNSACKKYVFETEIDVARAAFRRVVIQNLAVSDLLGGKWRNMPCHHQKVRAVAVQKMRNSVSSAGFFSPAHPEKGSPWSISVLIRIPDKKCLARIFV